VSDHPFYEVAAAVEGLLASGAVIFQKFTCAGCGQRLTMDVPNVLYKTGACDRCDTITDIEAQGCNYLLVAGPRAAELKRLITEGNGS
jgi:hypothetical protein